MSTAEYFSLCLKLAERADELGYASVKAVEHYFHDYGGHSPNPIVLLSAKESFVSAGRLGFHLMIVPFASNHDLIRGLVQSYRDAWREAGRAPGSEQIQSSLHCYIAETHKEAIEGFKQPVARYIEVFAEAVRSWEGQESGQYVGYSKLVEAITSLTGEKMIAGHTALVGTLDEVIEQIEYRRQLFGEHEPSMQINFGGIREPEAFRTLEIFAKHVMPRFT